MPWRLSSADRERFDRPRLWCRDSTQARANAASSISPASVKRVRTASAASSGTPPRCIAWASCARDLGAIASNRRQICRALSSGSRASGSRASVLLEPGFLVPRLLKPGLLASGLVDPRPLAPGVQSPALVTSVLGAPALVTSGSLALGCQGGQASGSLPSGSLPSGSEAPRSAAADAHASPDPEARPVRVMSY